MTHAAFWGIVWQLTVWGACAVLLFVIIRTAIVSAARSTHAPSVVTCSFCSTSLGVPAPGWTITHHADGSHTALPPLTGGNAR